MRSGPGERVAPARLDRLGGADEQAGLRPAQELVPAEADERGAGAHRAADGGLLGEQLDVVGQHAGADVVDHRHAELAQRVDLDLLDEADRAEVRRVRAEDDGGVGRRARPRSRPAARAVGRPDLDEPRPGLRDDVGDPKAAADLDELPARDDDRPSRARERRGGQQDGSRAVVDDERVLRAGHLAQQRVDVHVARAAVPGGEVELEVEYRQPPPPPWRARSRPTARGPGWCGRSRRWR